jgi:hypothetical protein
MGVAPLLLRRGVAAGEDGKSLLLPRRTRGDLLLLLDDKWGQGRRYYW